MKIFGNPRCAKSPDFKPVNKSNFVNILQSREMSENKFLSKRIKGLIQTEYFY